ncbi:hypothetical protein NG2371_05763 [Nocardia gamkensis]|uniref:hypothetical protein n=1 Tax=Nocardia gamkensis TaxID=352869 RepID=UPI0007A38C98|nr:hypothetical protein [Nocardia gamkensis]NQE71291.1 hypothetical protein [Nocardia gamkensis]
MVAVATPAGNRHQVLTGKQWELLDLLLPKFDGHDLVPPLTQRSRSLVCLGTKANQQDTRS